MNSNIKAGDKVDITLRGATVTTVNARGLGGIQVSHPGAYFDKLTYFSRTSGDLDIEVVEPEWQHGDVVACACDRVFIRRDEHWRTIESGIRATGPCLADDLTLLARDGRRVAS